MYVGFKLDPTRPYRPSNKPSPYIYIYPQQDWVNWLLAVYFSVIGAAMLTCTFEVRG